MSKNRQIVVSIDGKQFTSEGRRVDLLLDGKRVYSTEKEKSCNEIDVGKIDWSVTNCFLKIASSALGHPDRFRIAQFVTESPKSFTEIKNLLGTQSPTVNFHLKTLTDDTLIFKDKTGKYSASLMGELVLDYFAEFIKEASCLNGALAKERETNKQQSPSKEIRAP